MSLLFRPVVSYPVRCAAPVIFRPAAFPSVHDVAPLFSLFDESLAQLDRAARQAQRATFRRPFNPKFDVKEAQESYLVEGELPGFDPKDISIEFLDDGHTLQIKGKYVKETQNEQQQQQQAQQEAAKAVEATPAAPEQVSESSSSSVKSHQATVEDDTEEPANASATAAVEQAQTQVPETATATAEPSKQAEQQQQVAQQEQKEESPKKWISERYSGSFSRSFKFPSKVDQEAVKASLKDGILAITLPFARKPESRRIQIE